MFNLFNQYWLQRNKTVNVKSEKLDNVVKEAKENGLQWILQKNHVLPSHKKNSIERSFKEEAKSELDGLATKYEKYVTTIKDYKRKGLKNCGNCKVRKDEIKAKFPLLMEKMEFSIWTFWWKQSIRSIKYGHVFWMMNTTLKGRPGLWFNIWGFKWRYILPWKCCLSWFICDKTNPTGAN